MIKEDFIHWFLFHHSEDIDVDGYAVCELDELGNAVEQFLTETAERIKRNSHAYDNESTFEMTMENSPLNRVRDPNLSYEIKNVGRDGESFKIKEDEFEEIKRLLNSL